MSVSSITGQACAPSLASTGQSERGHCDNLNIVKCHSVCLSIFSVQSIADSVFSCQVQKTCLNDASGLQPNCSKVCCLLLFCCCVLHAEVAQDLCDVFWLTVVCCCLFRRAMVWRAFCVNSTAMEAAQLARLMETLGKRKARGDELGLLTDLLLNSVT